MNKEHSGATPSHQETHPASSPAPGESLALVKELRKTMFKNGLRMEWRENKIMFLASYGSIATLFGVMVFFPLALLMSLPGSLELFFFLILLFGVICLIAASIRGVYSLTSNYRCDTAFLYLSSLERGEVARDNARTGFLRVFLVHSVFSLVLFPAATAMNWSGLDALFFLLALLCWNLVTRMLKISVEVLTRVEEGRTSTLRGFAFLQGFIVYAPLAFLFLARFLGGPVFIWKAFGLFIILVILPISWFQKSNILPHLDSGWYEIEGLVTPELVKEGYQENREIPYEKSLLRRGIFDPHFFQVKEDRQGWDAVKDAFGVVAQRRTFGLGWLATIIIAICLPYFFTGLSSYFFLLFFGVVPVLSVPALFFHFYRLPDLSGRERQFLYMIPVSGEDLAFGMLKGLAIFMGAFCLLTVIPGAFILAEEPLPTLLVAVHVYLGVLLMVSGLVVHGECAGTRRKNVFQKMDGNWRDLLLELAVFFLGQAYLTVSVYFFFTVWGNWLLFTLQLFIFIPLTLVLLRATIKKAGTAYENRSIKT